VRVIDERGRLFGLVNVIDLALALAAVAAIAFGAAAYRVFVIPDPVLETVEPAEVLVGASPRVTLVGRHFRHYLRAFVPRTGTPFTVTPAQVDGPEARFAWVTEQRVELALPTLEPGPYDLYVFDDTKQIAYRRAAFTVVPPKFPRGLVDIHFYTYLNPTRPDLIKPADRDIAKVTDPLMPRDDAAEVTAARITPERTDDREMAFGQYQKGDYYLWFSQQGKRVIVDVTVRVPVVAVQPGRWQYKQTPVRVGETFVLETNRYIVRGPIVSIERVAS